MLQSIGRDLLHRFEGNPILTLKDMPYPCNTVFNGTPVKVGQEYLLLIRVEGLQGSSFFALARSADGLNFEMEPAPCMMPATDGPWRQWEEFGIEDPRLTYCEGVFYIVYTSVGRYGHCIMLASTEDFHQYERLGRISGPGNKDGVLFPEKIDGLYARLDRPIGRGIGSVWISYSPDLIHWGKSEFLFGPRPR